MGEPVNTSHGLGGGDPLLQRYEAFLARQRAEDEAARWGHQPLPLAGQHAADQTLNGHYGHFQHLPIPNSVQEFSRPYLMPAPPSYSQSLAQTVLNRSLEELAMLRPSPSQTPYSDANVTQHQHGAHQYYSQSPPRPDGTQTRPPTAVGLLPPGHANPFVQHNTSATAVYYAPAGQANYSPPRPTVAAAGPASSLLPTTMTVVDPVTGIEVPLTLSSASFSAALRSSEAYIAPAILPNMFTDTQRIQTKVIYHEDPYAIEDQMAEAAAYGAAYDNEAPYNEQPGARDPRRRITFYDDVSSSIAVPTYKDAHVGAPSGMSPLGNSPAHLEYAYNGHHPNYNNGSIAPLYAPYPQPQIQPSAFYPDPRRVVALTQQ
eukprot:GILI01023143.1.p1 GENE.GILI01023143.1~~GILI01023143.1.p1  ORF type:complete len:400 (+),score=44.29 GILI01023143.1:79-1200(+)